MDDRSQTRREMHQVLNGDGERPAPSLGITRRTFLHRSLLAGAGLGIGTHGWFPLINTVDLAFGASEFKFAWISDTHLYPKSVNTRFVDTAVRAVKEVQAMSPPADFLIVGGDIGQLGDPVELELGAEILKEVTIKKLYIPGEHDWYLDMGVAWEKLYGHSPWAMDHKGVRFIGLDTVSRAPDFWTIKKMTPKERMGHMAVLDGSVAGAWAGVGRDQLAWLDRALADWPKDKPVVLFSHNPLWEYYAPWNFWVRDWREVHEILKPFSNVTNVHGHVHQVLYNEIGKMRSIGMLATSWPWPYPPQGVPALSPCQTRVDPGDPYDGVGWSRLTMTTKNAVDNEYVMWRKDVIGEAPWDSGCGDNNNQILSPRLADQIWPHYGAYK
ncbi:MAG: metallophosphoesterase [Candidatus Rokuibacteriota bacterium]|nr:MAG: metallophosphoesterase [Candidatus Rokubacteria bacterium]